MCGLSSCVTFNTGAKLDSIGKAVPTYEHHFEGQYYLLHGVAYREIMVEYRQVNPKLMGIVLGHYIDTCHEDLPAPNSPEFPKAELYLVRLDPERTDKPTFIRAIDFDYARAKAVDAKTLPVSYVHSSYFKRGDLTTLTPTQYESLMVLRELPTIRTTGNKIRQPLAVALSYGVDLPLTAASYAAGSVLHLLLLPFGI